MANPTDFPPVSGAAAALYYWDGFNWQKWQGTLPGYTPTNPLAVISTNGDKLFGYESLLATRKQNTALGVGTNDLNADAVPAGKVWVIEHVSAIYIGTPPTVLSVEITVGAAVIDLLREVAITSGRAYPAPHRVILTSAVGLRAHVEGAALNDSLYLDYNGYQMDAS